MRIFTLLCVLLATTFGFSQNAPVDFEPAGEGGSWTWTVFENDTNPPLQVIANPDPTGVNTSATVAEFTALQTGQPFAGVESMHGADIGTFTLDATNALVKIWVWKPVISDVGIKFATLSGASTGEIKVANTLINQWEELTFDFSSKIGEPSSTDIDQIVVFPDFDARAQDNVIYFDQITFEAPPAPMTLPLDFEGAAPTFNDFNGSFTQVIPNPDPTGINMSANVAENTVPGGAAFAGVNIPVTVDITADKMFTMNVWSPLSGTPVLLKLENSVTNVNVERQANMTSTSAWEDLMFDFSSEGALTFDSVTVFMNFNMVDANSQTYYWDNLEQVLSGPPLAVLPLTLEGTPPTFNDFNGSATQVIANPDASGVNTSANVSENVVPSNAAFAGVNIPVATIDISTEKMFTMNVWSPLAGTPVLLKLENSVTNVNVERQANMTTTSAWEDLMFDFSSEGALTFDSVTIFMNFNVVDPNSQTYYWDNLVQVAGPMAPFVPIDFEPGGNGANWTWTVFENDTNPPLQIIANPDASGINTSATVAEFTALQAGQPFAGVESMHGADIGTFTLDASNSTVRIMVWKPVISDVGIKFATLSGASTGEIKVANTLINQWEELTFDFSGVIGDPANTDIDQIIIFPDFDARAMDNVVYFDNIEFGPFVPVVTTLPLDFESVAPVFNDFNGSFTHVISNPDPTGVNMSANVAENTVPAGAAFAGVNIVVEADITTDKFFRMDVWSPLAGTPVLLKLEGGPNPPIERQATLTTTGAWEEIVFDFSAEGALVYDSVTVFMNFNMVDGADQTYYWDNLELYTPLTNDTCAGATPVVCGDVILGDTSDNTDTGGSNASFDEWYAFTGTGATEFVTVSLCDGGTTYDSLLTVFDACGGAVVATNDDSCGLQSEVSFVSDGTSTYYIAIEGFGANAGIFSMAITCDAVAANDECANAEAMSCGDVVTGSTNFATVDTAATDCGVGITAPGVWYTFTDTTGLLTDYEVNLCDGNTTFDTKLTVYVGDDCGTLTCIGDNDDDCGLQSAVSWSSADVTTYYVLVHGFGNATGDFSLSLNCELVPPANDMIVNAIDVDELGCPYTDTNVAFPAATEEGANPMDCNIDGAKGVWYKITPEATGDITASISTPAGSSFVNFFSAPDENATVTDLILVDWFDNQCAPATSTTIPGVAGQAYYIFVVNTGGASDVVVECQTLGVDSVENLNISTYPNPMQTEWTVVADESISEITIYNVLGQPVINVIPKTSQYVVDVASLSGGMYVAKVATSKGTQSFKLIKE